jgi:hypothetical protein
MPTTSKMGIVYPSSSDLVKDGATNMGTIATTVDAKTGLVFINTTSFSAVSSQSINDVFSANYDHYKILATYTASVSDSELKMRYRVGGADNSSNVYMAQRIIGENTSLTGEREDPATSSRLFVQNSNENVGEATIFNPFKTARTYFNSSSAYATTTDASRLVLYSGVHKASTSFTGFTLLPASGTITGSISVFGYNK